MSAIPDYGLKNEDGRQILNREYRFNHLWYASKILIPYDNDSQDDYPFTGNVNPPPEDRGLPQLDTIIPVPIL
jgi:hypothetical protein